jgi:phosphoribosylaminoimidazolecarboxamide formyltransferase/IMP cyclohydrolase
MIRKVTKIDDLVRLKTAMITVTDKTGLDTFVPGLIKINPEIKIFTTGGTYEAIKKIVTPEQLAKNVVEVSVYTGQPESEGGLVKTLHHKLFLGYLTETYCVAHQNDLRREDAIPIDLLICNLYPFKKVVEQPDIDLEDARGNIDVGGPSALRAAAKNFHRVMIAPDPKYYRRILGEFQIQKGKSCLRERFLMAQHTFKILAEYDSNVATYLWNVLLSDVKSCYKINHLSKGHQAP